MSRYAAAPRQGHLTAAEHLLGYLKTYPCRGYLINPKEPQIDPLYKVVTLPTDFGNQYNYFQEDIDPRFPTAVLKEMMLSIFVDSDHAYDTVTGRSVTGMISFLGSTPLTWMSKKQKSVQTSTFGAEFTALKQAVDEAVTLRYHLRSMGIKVMRPTTIYMDNMSVVLNATNPGSPLNKKCVALAYHFVREHVANKVVEIRKIDSTDNYADPFTKPMNGQEHGDFFWEFMCNPKYPVENKSKMEDHTLDLLGSNNRKITDTNEQYTDGTMTN